MKKQTKDQIGYIFGQLGVERIDEILALESLIFATQWSKEQYIALMQAGVCKVFGASEGAPDGPLAAYVAAGVNRAAGELEIYNTAVRPQARRMGLGSRLMRLLLAAGQNLGLERALLEVRQSNRAARNLYEGLGFKPCGLRVAYYAMPVEDAVLYEYPFM